MPNNGTNYKPWFVPQGQTTKRPKVLNDDMQITVIRVEDIEDISSAVPMKDPSSSSSSVSYENFKISEIIYFYFLSLIFNNLLLSWFIFVIFKNKRNKTPRNNPVLIFIWICMNMLVQVWYLNYCSLTEAFCCKKSFLQLFFPIDSSP